MSNLCRGGHFSRIVDFVAPLIQGHGRFALKGDPEKI
jgi:hypothetical protein